MSVDWNQMWLPTLTAADMPPPLIQTPYLQSIIGSSQGLNPRFVAANPDAAKNLPAQITPGVNQPIADPAGYVTSLYQSFLGRSPDPGGLQSWVDKLKGGLSAFDVSQGFAMSPEAQAYRQSQAEAGKRAIVDQTAAQLAPPAAAPAAAPAATAPPSSVPASNLQVKAPDISGLGPDLSKYSLPSSGLDLSKIFGSIMSNLGGGGTTTAAPTAPPTTPVAPPPQQQMQPPPRPTSGLPQGYLDLNSPVAGITGPQLQRFADLNNRGYTPPPPPSR